jgi:hypothetical protein
MSIYQPITITEEIEQSFKSTRLAVKELNGLKYFCKSVRKNFEKYKGSGLYWTNHVRKSGKENVKTLWVSDWFYCPHHIQEFALMFGEYNQIVESNQWANLMPEYGIGGGSKYWKGKKRPEHSKRMAGEGHPQYGRRGVDSPNHGKVRSDTHKKILSLSKTGDKNPRYGKPDMMKNPKYHKTCDHCGVTVDLSKFARYHGDNCDHNPLNRQPLTFTNKKMKSTIVCCMFEFERDIILPKTKYPTQSIYRLRNGKSAFGWKLSQV